jgi:hypothetical protein
MRHGSSSSRWIERDMQERPWNEIFKITKTLKIAKEHMIVGQSSSR